MRDIFQLDNGAQFFWRWGTTWLDESTGEKVRATDDSCRRMLTSRQRERNREVSARLSSATDVDARSELKRQLILLNTAHEFSSEWDGRRRTVLKTSNPWTLLVADYDVLPVGRLGWAEFRRELKERFPHAVVMSTPSGKAKALFLAKSGGLPIDSKQGGPRWQATKAIVGDELSGFDPATGASYLVFMTEEMIAQWLGQKADLRSMGRLQELAGAPQEAPAPEEEAQPEAKRPKASRTKPRVPAWDRYRGAIPLRLMAMGRGAHWAPFLRLLIASPSDAEGRRIVSHERLSKRLGVTARAVGKMLSKLEAAGLLQHRTSGFREGEKRRASTYEFGEVLGALHAPTPLSSLPDPLQVEIPDGEWHTSLLQYARKAKDKESFLLWVGRVAGAEMGDRLEQADKIISNWLARRARAEWERL